MARLLFEKTGNAIWISHLDLMRLFQRAFKRAGFPLKHTQGYNPKPSVSIALPLSVGVESCCELLDYEIECEIPDDNTLIRRLNEALVEGVKVLQIIPSARKIRDIALLECEVTLEYDSGAGETTMDEIRQLFQRESLPVIKKSKNGPVEQDIIPLIKRTEVFAGEQELVIRALVCCQNPSMNPVQLLGAIERYLPELKPDHATYRRVEIYDNNENIFR